MCAAPSGAPLRILLVDDSPDFLEAAALFLGTDPQIEIVGRALSGRDALRQVTKLNPDLVLMDLAMPEMNGLDATRQIKSLPGAPHVILLTLHDDPEYRAAARAAQADEFVPKDALAADLLPAIRRAAHAD